jgi:hypothetical protein
VLPEGDDVDGQRADDEVAAVAAEVDSVRAVGTTRGRQHPSGIVRGREERAAGGPAVGIRVPEEELAQGDAALAAAVQAGDLGLGDPVGEPEVVAGRQGRRGQLDDLPDAVAGNRCRTESVCAIRSAADPA